MASKYTPDIFRQFFWLEKEGIMPKKEFCRAKRLSPATFYTKYNAWKREKGLR